jgi:hypothetical protein
MLRSDWTAQQNLWESARVATILIFKRYKVYNIGDEHKELFEEVMLRGVQNFLREKVMNHKYDRRYPWLNNMLSAVWQSAGFVINKYIEMTRRRIDAVPLDAEVKNCPGSTVGELIADTGDNRVGSSYRVIPLPVLSMLDRERFGFSNLGRGGSLPLASCPEQILRAIWELDDEDAAEAGLIVTIEEKQRREELVKKLPPPSKSAMWWQRYQAKRRSEQNKKEGG